MTMTQEAAGAGAVGLRAAAVGALDRARDHLLALQDPRGWWKGELETNVTIDAEDLLLREFLGVRTEHETQAAARWIRSKQRVDGTWANFYYGPPDLSTTVEAYVALRLAGDPPAAAHMSRAAAFIRASGGVAAARVFTRIWLALFGQWPWRDLPVMPPELIYLPRWFPLNVYDWACWARQTIVPLTVVGSMRPVHALPFGLPELQCTPSGPDASHRQLRPRRLAERPAKNLPERGHLDTGAGPPAGRPGDDPRIWDWPPLSWAGFFGGLDRLLHRYENGPVRAATAAGSCAPKRSGASLSGGAVARRFNPAAAARRAALRRCAEWIIARQEADGCWGGIQPPWVYSLIALYLLGYRLDHPVMRRALAGLDRFIVTEKTPEGPVRRLEACQSPVWDTVLSMIALADAGARPDDPALARAARWVLDEEMPGPGDWQVRRPWLTPSGWAFEFDNDGYPDIDDTAVAVLALRRAAPLVAKGTASLGVGGADWTAGADKAHGGHGAHSADEPDAAHGADEPDDTHVADEANGADVAIGSHAMAGDDGADDTEWARAGGAGPDSPESLLHDPGTFLENTSEKAPRSWNGRADPSPPTRPGGAAGLAGPGDPGRAAGVAAPAGAAVERALRWLEGMQSRDGGWGAFDADNTQQLCTKLPFCDFGAVIDPPSADVTAHVVEALSAAGLAEGGAARRGVVWLLRAQEPDGSWFGRWGANYVYGTGAVLPALIAAGVKPGRPVIRRAVDWLESHQNPDGGWGEDLRSYDDPGLAGTGESTASQTAWALIGLLAAGGSAGSRPRWTQACAG